MYSLFKRFLDILGCIIILPFFLILFFLVFLLIKFDDGGPVFYRSFRIGQNGKLFKMYKFRSMKVNAPDIRTADGSTYNGKDDTRVTKVGKILRETSIDELPQIFNVLKGNMSFIGPRPDPPDWINKYPDEYRVFLSVKPGITGYNQAYFRNDADSLTKMKNDAFYACNCSLWLDIKIFFKTLKTVFEHEGIYRG